MKTNMTKRMLAFALVVMMLVTTCISYTASAAALTITASPAATDGAEIRSDSADAAVLTDGVKTGSYNGGDAVTTQGTDKWTDYSLSFASQTTVDTLVVYAAAPYGGGSWNVSDDAAFYSVVANYSTVAITSVSVDRTNEEYPVVTIKFDAIDVTSLVLSIKNYRYCSAIFEIEAVEAAAAPESSEEASEYPSADVEESSEVASDKYFDFDMSATANAEDSSIIDVVISIKDVKEQLHAVEFLLNFDPALVEGVVQESEGPMDVFMTKVPMYTMVVQGMEFQMPRYEQICTYEPENKYYHLRFIDLLQYAGAKEGEEYPGLINDGDLIVTIQFRIIDADATEFEFTATNVKGTTTEGLNSVPGTNASATYTVKADDVTSEDETTVDPVTSEDVTSDVPVTSDDVTSDDVTSEDVSEAKTPVDLGDEFYANINIPALDKTFTKVGADVKATDADGSDEQIWKFVKIDATNAYVISNLVEGGYLAVQGELSAALANVYISIDAQEYYIYEVNGKYAISPVGYDNKAVDVNGVDFNVQYWDFNEANACQQYDIVKVELDDTTSEDVTSEDVTSEDTTTEDVTSEDVASEDVTSEDTTDKVFGFDMSVVPDEEDSSLLNVVISIKDIKEQLHAVEFLLTFDPSIVEGVVKESEGPMDVFMTKVPMYTMQVGEMEFQMPRYEQICTYEPENKYYHLRFIDLLQYAGAKPGEEYPGLINDGDLIVTIQFQIIDADATEFTFEAKDVKGTTTVGLNGVKGAPASVTYTVEADDVTSEETTVDPVTSEDETTVDPVTSEDVTTVDPVTSEDVTSEDVTSEDVTSEDVTSDDVTSDDVTSDDVTSDDVTSDDVTSDDVTSDDVTSDDVTSDDVTSDDPVVKENYAKDKNYTVSGSFLSGKADDGVILTDGIIPESEIAGSIVSFSGTGAANTIIVDLAKVYKDINQIVVGGVVIENNRKYGSIVIEISADGENYTVVEGWYESEEEYAGTTYNYIYDLASDVAAQYIKITIVSTDYVLTVGDIQVYGSGNVVDDESSDDVTSDDVTSDDVTSDDVTSDDVTSDDVTSDDVTSDDVTSDDVTSDDETSDDETSDDETTEDTPVDPGKPGDSGIVMFVVLAVIALAALVVCKKARRA